MRALTLHPSCTPGAVTAVEATLIATPQGCRAAFIAHGDVAELALPERRSPGRADELWRTTCFEVFWQGAGATAYREFNLSPSSQWAAYDFDDHRTGMADAAADVRIDYALGRSTVHVTATITSPLPRPARVGLTAVIAELNGHIGYWALAFTPGAPDFHSPAARTLAII